MNFAQCRAYLDSLQVMGIKLGLDNIRGLLQALDNPHLSYPTLLVAGTNGKGSVCAMLTRILGLHGLRLGLYTSPHLVSVRERIRINDRQISSAKFCQSLTAVREAADRLLGDGALPSPPTHFEVLTCAAFWHFREKKVEAAVLEVGLGGRFDATNVVQPLLSIITSISHDHEQYLGRTLGQIAFEKAGIIKPGVPVVSGVEGRTAAAVIQKRARKLAAPYIGVFDPPRTLIALKRDRAENYRFIYKTPQNRFSYTPRLLGYHQGRNAAVALAAAVQLGRVWRPLQKTLMVRGVEESYWPGRLEIVRRRPPIILDGAHNLEGTRAVRDYIRDFVRQPLILLFAAMRDKDIRGISRVLFPLATRVVLTRFPYSRAAEPDDILRQARRFAGRISVEADTAKAFHLALAEARRQKGCLLVTGSLFLVGEIKKISAHKSESPVGKHGCQ